MNPSRVVVMPVLVLATILVTLAFAPGGCMRAPLTASEGPTAAPAAAPAEPVYREPIWAREGPTQGEWRRCPPGSHAEWRPPVLGAHRPPVCIPEPIQGPGQ